MTVYMLWDPRRKGINQVLLGGGSSTSPSPRVYETEAVAIRMRDRYFRGCKIKPVTLP